MSCPLQGGVFLLDLQCGVGGLFEAFAVKRQSYNIPLFYMACFEDQMGLEWFQKTKQAFVADEFAAGNLSVPGFATPPADMPLDLLEMSLRRQCLKP